METTADGSRDNFETKEVQCPEFPVYEVYLKELCDCRRSQKIIMECFLSLRAWVTLIRIRDMGWNVE
jgi:hypothetical protein